jgi:hypothetical protein
MKTKRAEITVSAKSIDDALYNAYRASLDYKYSGDERATYIAVVVNNAIHWYVSTGRAYPAFLKALVNLSKCRMRNMYKKCIAADTGTEVDAIKVIKAYMKV